VINLTDADATAASDVVAAVLAHDILQRARAASRRASCRRETPVTLCLPDGTLLEGIVDLAFEEDGRWLVVEYKTDREIRGNEDHYRRQVAVYATAIAHATGCETNGVILRI
jgi:ATP-dependent helicase/nuclease subunit A